MRQPPTGTVTFLFTDIQSSTRLWEHSPEQMRPALARHDRLLRDAVEDHGGYVFKTVGDAFCAAFPTAPEALAAALAAQLALAAEPWGTGTPLRVRMALHAGSAEERDGDYFGPPLNRVARLMSAGHGGQVLVSAVTQELVRDHLPDGVGLRDLGEARLKDLGRPEHVFDLVHPDLPADFPPLRSVESVPNNLPQQATSFIGRETQCAAVQALVDKSRLVTLAGSGGAGKSRLSVQVAADMLDQFPDGAWLVELAPLSDPTLVPQTVAQALGVREDAGRPLARTLVEWLKSKRLLLLLDNCEHLVAACATLAADLLRRCLGVKLLTTSREPLNVSGEQTYRVPSLSLPDPKLAQTVGDLSQYEAVRLFIERAQAVQPSFTVTDANAPAVAQVCFHLDGIPLAIELAAVRVRSLSVEDINARLDNRFRLLTGGARNTLPRQQTLRALIDWSYDLLTEPEKALLRRLSVFAGGWTLAAAEWVCSEESIQDWEIFDLLTNLVDKSLVVAEEKDGSVRYRLLETVREYARDLLVEGGDERTVRGIHRDYFLRFAEEARPKLFSGEQVAYMSLLVADHSNLLFALEWSRRGAGEAEPGLRLAAALWRFWWDSCYFSEGRQQFDAVLAHEGAVSHTKARADALIGAGIMAQMQLDWSAAERAYSESLAISQELGAESEMATAIGRLGDLAMVRADNVMALTLLREALAMHRRLGNQWDIGHIAICLGYVALSQGDWDEAQTWFDECLATWRELGDRRYSYALNNLAALAFKRGDLEAASAHLDGALRLQEEAGDRWSIPRTLVRLGAVSIELGDYSRGRYLLAEGILRGQNTGNRWAVVNGIEDLGNLAAWEKQPTRAARLYGAVDGLDEEHHFYSAVVPEQHSKRIAVCAELGGATFAAAREEGRAMTLQEAVEYALGMK